MVSWAWLTVPISIGDPWGSLWYKVPPHQWASSPQVSDTDWCWATPLAVVQDKYLFCYPGTWISDMGLGVGHNGSRLRDKNEAQMLSGATFYRPQCNVRIRTNFNGHLCKSNAISYIYIYIYIPAGSIEEENQGTEKKRIKQKREWECGIETYSSPKGSGKSKYHLITTYHLLT